MCDSVDKDDTDIFRLLSGEVVIVEIGSRNKNSLSMVGITQEVAGSRCASVDENDVETADFENEVLGF
ncbi:hypothetical protein TNCV_3460281 [Trichonephila clavipes]|nr:hypothetical protein TNCV_3460281 [Trichonephila clavipes]